MASWKIFNTGHKIYLLLLSSRSGAFDKCPANYPRNSEKAPPITDNKDHHRIAGIVTHPSRQKYCYCPH